MNLLQLISFTSIILALVFWILRWFFSKNEVVKSNINRHPVTSIFDFKNQDVGCIQGKIIGSNKNLIAPLSETHCEFYNSQVRERWHYLGRDMWEIIIDYIPNTYIIISDGTGYAYVRTLSALVNIGFHGESIVNAVNSDMPGLNWLMEKCEINPASHSGKGKIMLCKEGVVFEGEEIKVKGCGIWYNTKEIDIDLPVDQILVFEADPNYRLYISLP